MRGGVERRGVGFDTAVPPQWPLLSGLAGATGRREAASTGNLNRGIHGHIPEIQVVAGLNRKSVDSFVRRIAPDSDIERVTAGLNFQELN